MTATNWARIAVVLIGALIVQVALLDNVVVLGSHPDVMVLLVASAGLLAGAQYGAIVAFVIGGVADLVVNTPFGLSSLAFVFIGFGCGMLRTISSERSSRSTEVAFCIAGGVSAVLLFALIGALIGQPGMFSSSLASTVLDVIVGGIVLAPVVLVAMRWAFSGNAGAHANLTVPSGGSAVG